MKEPTASRRDVLRWIVSSFVLASAGATAAIHRNASWDSASVTSRCNLLFREHLPDAAKLAAAESKQGVFAAIFEQTSTDEHPVTQRWLCLAYETDVGHFDVQTSSDALVESTRFHPVEASVSIDGDGAVHTAEQLLRGHHAHTWTRVDGRWELAASNRTGVTAGKIYQEEYDQLRQEVVVSSGRLEDEALASTRHSKTETVALTTYSRGPLV